ncbi:hypothetical protein ACB094_09G014300 [Castanea mollissima]
MATDSSEQLNLNNPTTTTTTAAAEENPKQTLDDDSTTTAAVPPTTTTTEPDHLEEEEEEEEEPTDEASDQPSVTTVDSDAKSCDESKSAVAVAAAAAATASPVAGDVVDANPDSNIQKKIRRAERFGISLQLTEEEKRNSRKERFGTGSTVPGSDSEAFKKSEDLKRKARAERFGIRDSPVATDEDAKKKARLAKFAPVSKTDPLEEEKRKARMIRFSNPPKNSSSPVNGKGNMESAAIAGKAGGGV